MIEILAEPDRVRRHTARATNQRIDRRTRANVSRYATRSRGEISRRIAELGAERDIEQTLATNASILALAGVGLAAARGSRWLLVPATVLGFLLMHANQGWCPPLPLFRRLGVRTRSEIEHEAFALRLMRGDYDAIAGHRQAPARAESALDEALATE